MSTDVKELLQNKPLNSSTARGLRNIIVELLPFVESLNPIAKAVFRGYAPELPHFLEDIDNDPEKLKDIDDQMRRIINAYEGEADAKRL